MARFDSLVSERFMAEPTSFREGVASAGVQPPFPRRFINSYGPDEDEVTATSSLI